MTKKKERWSTIEELAQLWYFRYGTKSIIGIRSQRPMVSLKALAKAAKITVSQLTIRLRKHEL